MKTNNAALEIPEYILEYKEAKPVRAAARTHKKKETRTTSPHTPENMAGVSEEQKADDPHARNSQRSQCPSTPSMESVESDRSVAPDRSPTRGDTPRDVPLSSIDSAEEEIAMLQMWEEMPIRFNLVDFSHLGPLNEDGSKRTPSGDDMEGETPDARAANSSDDENEPPKDSVMSCMIDMIATSAVQAQHDKRRILFINSLAPPDQRELADIYILSLHQLLTEIGASIFSSGRDGWRVTFLSSSW